MSKKQINWCNCGRQYQEYWRIKENVYGLNFAPTAWAFEYRTITCHEEGRVLYITGQCSRCDGFMRSGVPVPTDMKGGDLLAYVYHEMEHYRPYDKYDEEFGIYYTFRRQRCQWYQQQDDLTPEERRKQFLRLFRAEDQAAVKDWLARNPRVEPYAKPRRDRKSTLFQHILETARAAGAITEAEAILDDIYPSKCVPAVPEEDTHLTDHRFNLIPDIKISGHRIDLNLCLEGSFDNSFNRKTTIGTLTTLRVDQEACDLMKALGDTLAYYCCKYVNEEIHRYTPRRELEREADQK